MIYFDEDMNAYGFKIDNYIASTTDEIWEKHCLDNDSWTIKDGKFVDLTSSDDYKTIQAEKREEEFKENFFEIPSYGWFRRTPKGYTSAVEAVNTAFNAAQLSSGTLQSGLLTFYTEPDFTDETQCEEDWLIENSFTNEAMTQAEFLAFYTAFVTAWNNEEHL